MSTYPPGSRSETIERPGASRSACRAASPRVLNSPTTSSPGVAVPAVGPAEHPDVQPGVGAVRDRPVDRGDDLGDVDGAVRRGDLHVDQLRVRGDADEVL